MKKELDVEKVIEALIKVLPKERPIALHEPMFAGNEWAYVKECLDTGWVSSVGMFVNKFEEFLADFTGVNRAVAIVNGTSALHICLLLVGVVPGDEVLVPTLTFVATANAVAYCGAVPHFVDIEERTLGLDPHKLKYYLDENAELRKGVCYNRKTGRRIKAVVPVHTFGHPVDLDPLFEVCRHYNLEMVEDGAESLGSYYKGRHLGNWGHVSALSFNGNKVVTTGGGGAIITNDESLAAKAKHLTTTARIPHQWVFYHDEVGYNYRLPNINAALGCAQLEQLPNFLKKKRSLARRYEKAFKDIKNVRFFVETNFAQSNYWLNVLLLDEECANERDNLLELTNSMGITTRPAWVLMHKLATFKHCPKMDLSVSESIEKRLINIPSSAILGDAYA